MATPPSPEGRSGDLSLSTRMGANTDEINKNLAISNQKTFTTLAQSGLSMTKFFALWFVPAMCAVTPVLIPFGDAYEHSDDWVKNLQENWSYFFWYNTVGWSFLWLTMTVWTR